jgi:hypothetical protein
MRRIAEYALFVLATDGAPSPVGPLVDGDRTFATSQEPSPGLQWT